MKNILVAIDFTEANKSVLKYAKKMAKEFHSTITIIHSESIQLFLDSYEINVMPSVEIIETQKKIIEDRLNQIEKEFDNENIKVKTILLEGATVKNILREAKKCEADLIITGSHKHGRFYNLLIGSTTNSLIKNSSIPILIIPSTHDN